jgi:hypothetical protein
MISPRVQTKGITGLALLRGERPAPARKGFSFLLGCPEVAHALATALPLTPIVPAHYPS